MSTSSPEDSRYLEAAAVVWGWPACVLAGLLTLHEARAQLAKLPAAQREPVEAAISAIAAAGRAWSSASGRVSGGPAETGSDLGRMTTTQVADELCVCKRRVTQLAGALHGTKREGRWSFDRGAVHEYRDQRKAEDAQAHEQSR